VTQRDSFVALRCPNDKPAEQVTSANEHFRKGVDKYVRIIGAVGSNPITSTRARSPPGSQRRLRALYHYDLPSRILAHSGHGDVVQSQRSHLV
jgi:hypothetical protein